MHTPTWPQLSCTCLGVCLFSISPSPLVKVPGPKLHTGCSNPPQNYSLIWLVSVLYQYCYKALKRPGQLCLKGFISDPRGSCLWTSDAWSYYLCLLWWNAYKVHTGHGLFNTKVTSFLASYGLLFCIWSEVCRPCTFFFFFLAFQEYLILMSVSVPKGLNNLDLFLAIF